MNLSSYSSGNAYLIFKRKTFSFFSLFSYIFKLPMTLSKKNGGSFNSWLR